jgi:hypothetical protein
MKDHRKGLIFLSSGDLNEVKKLGAGLKKILITVDLLIVELELFKKMLGLFAEAAAALGVDCKAVIQGF